MKLFSPITALLTFYSAVSAANTVTFIGQDTITRTVYFTANAGLPSVAPIRVVGGESVVAHIPQGWIGNWYSVHDGAPNIPGMLGEVAFNAWGGITFFDVSAIVNPNDKVNVQEMWPMSGQTPTSGCRNFPCNNAYYLPDDVQTKATTETDLVCTLGSGVYRKEDRRDVEEQEEEDLPSFKRGFVLGKYT